MTRPTATSVSHIADERFSVTEWRFAPGAETGWHIHGHDYVVVPLTDGQLALELPGGGNAEAALKKGIPYSRQAGVEHNVINAGSQPLAFLEVEWVAECKAAARVAVLKRFMAAWNMRDIDGLMDCMAEDCAFNASAGPEIEGARYIGRDAVRAAYAALFETFPEARWYEDSHKVVGDMGISEWRFTGTDTSGQKVDVKGCDIFRFDGEHIALKDSYRKARKV